LRKNGDLRKLRSDQKLPKGVLGGCEDQESEEKMQEQKQGEEQGNTPGSFTKSGQTFNCHRPIDPQIGIEKVRRAHKELNSDNFFLNCHGYVM
jgi:hypothetical protein